MMVTAEQEIEDRDAIDKGISISAGALAVVLWFGGVATELGYPQGIAHATTTIGIATVAVGGVWVIYIIYDLYRTLSEQDGPPTEHHD